MIHVSAASVTEAAPYSAVEEKAPLRGAPDCVPPVLCFAISHQAAPLGHPKNGVPNQQTRDSGVAHASATGPGRVRPILPGLFWLAQPPDPFFSLGVMVSSYSLVITEVTEQTTTTMTRRSIP
jgi:hypothetical protein